MRSSEELSVRDTSRVTHQCIRRCHQDDRGKHSDGVSKEHQCEAGAVQDEADGEEAPRFFAADEVYR